ncbi:MAG: DUF58 domain-containing protein [Betaproteobacteria bacterium]
MPAALASTSSWTARWRQRAFRHAPADLDPVVLRHSRIYILPTRRGLAFLATLAIMLVTSLNYALSLGFVVTFLLAGLVGSALLHTFRNLAGIELRPLAAGEAFAGSVLPFTVAIAGGATARRAVSLAARGARVTMDVPAGAALPALLDVPTSRRGRIALGRVTLSSDYPLGLWRGWAYVHFPLTGVVYPAPELNAPPLPPGSAGDDAQTSARGDDADLAGLRTYQDGDPLQRVAWKAVARGAGWYTKQFDGAGGGGPAVLAWRSLPGAMSAEGKLARLVAWVLAAERAARPFTLSAPGIALPAGQGRDHRRAALTALALVSAPD